MKHMLAPFALCAAAFVAPASADTLTYGVPLSGSGPTAQFATLSYTQIGNGDDWSFMLSADDLEAVFGSADTFLGSIAVQTSQGEPTHFGRRLLMTDVEGDVDRVQVRPGGGPGGDFDFRFVFGKGHDRLGSDESVSWTWIDSGVQSFEQLALHVQNVGGTGGSIWYSPTAVPEPATYALMLAGVGIIMMRRTRQRH